jgi:hypothetical protein
MPCTAKNTWILRLRRSKERAKRQAFYRNISKLEFRNKVFNTESVLPIYMSAREFMFKLNLSEEQSRELALYIRSLPPHDLLFGLRFAYSRYAAESGGYLMPGRKSLVKRETLSLTEDQANWRLNNWKAMIKTYREKGYSYPTISRIKKQVQKIASKKYRES